MLISDIESASLVECRSELAVHAFNVAYAGYLVPLTMTLERFERRFRAEDLDPFASRVWSEGHEPAALLLVARRGRESRIAAIGVAERLRGRGLGRAVCQHAVDEAHARGDAKMWLEVFEANARARSLYLHVGFQDHSRLLGFSSAARRVADTLEAVTEIPVRAGVELGVRQGAHPDLPWMLEAATLAAATSPVRCFRDQAGEAVAFVDDQVAEVRLIGLLGSMVPARAPSFMDALRARYPGRPWMAQPIYPEHYGASFFEPAGWQPSERSQWRMVHTLGEGEAVRASR